MPAMEIQFITGARPTRRLMANASPRCASIRRTDSSRRRAVPVPPAVARRNPPLRLRPSMPAPASQASHRFSRSLCVVRDARTVWRQILGYDDTRHAYAGRRRGQRLGKTRVHGSRENRCAEPPDHDEHGPRRRLQHDAAANQVRGSAGRARRRRSPDVGRSGERRRAALGLQGGDLRSEWQEDFVQNEIIFKFVSSLPRSEKSRSSSTPHACLRLAPRQTGPG